MKFADFMCESAICVDIKATDKVGVIQELVNSLVSAGQVKEEDRDSIVEAIMKREELGSTGIGRGVAVPHTKHSSVESLIGTVGVSAEGVEFDSLDGEPVQLLFDYQAFPFYVCSTIDIIISTEDAVVLFALIISPGSRITFCSPPIGTIVPPTAIVAFFTI